MKRLLLVLVAVMAINFSVMADGAPRKGAFGIQTALALTTSSATSTTGSLGAKFFITDPIAIRAALGFANSTTTGGGGGTGFDLNAGFEYHFSGKGGVSPYAGAQLGWGIVSPAGGGNATNSFGVDGVFGAEYFFSSNFSAAGELMLGYSTSVTGGASSSTFGTNAVLFILTWYLN